MIAFCGITLAVAVGICSWDFAMRLERYRLGQWLISRWDSRWRDE